MKKASDRPPIGKRILSITLLLIISCILITHYELYADPSSVNDSNKREKAKNVSVAGATNNVVDADGDQIPDDWEYNNCTNHNCDPNGDEDGDGVNNLIEFQLNSDPKVKNLPGTGIHYEYDELGRIIRIVRIP